MFVLTYMKKKEKSDAWKCFFFPKNYLYCKYLWENIVSIRIFAFFTIEPDGLMHLWPCNSVYSKVPYLRRLSCFPSMSP